MPAFTAISPETFHEPLREQIERAPLPGLREEPTTGDLARWIGGHPNLSHEERPLDVTAADCCRSGLWLLAGDLERSHEISQRIHTAEGSYWHGIMHRREGDYGNAKYWFRRAGHHGASAAMLEAARSEGWGDSPVCAGGTWDPAALVDLYQEAVRADAAAQDQARSLGWIEWQILFAHCYKQAWPNVDTRMSGV